MSRISSATIASSSTTKIRRPDIGKVVQADLDIIKNLANLLERRLPALTPYRPVGLAREFERTLKIADEVLRFVSVATDTRTPKTKPGKTRRPAADGADLAAPAGE